MKKSLRAGAKLLALLASAFLMFNVTACSSDDDEDTSTGGGNTSTGSQDKPEQAGDGTTVEASLNYATNANYWTVNNGTLAVSDGVLSLTGVDAEGLAIQLSDATFADIKEKLGTKFYVQAVLKAKTAMQGNKNFGVASIINTENSEFAYAGVNGNGRTQLGTKTTPKGAQFGSLISDTSLLTVAEWPQYYTIRYEYDNGTITGYINGIQFNKNGTKTYGVSGAGTLGSVGIYACKNDFEMKSFVCGAISDTATNEDTATLRIKTTESTLVTLLEGTDKYVFLPDVAYEGTAKDEPVEFTIKAIGNTYNETTWSFTNSDSNLLKVEKAEDTLKITVLSKTAATAKVTVTNNDKAGTKSVSRVITVNIKDVPDYVDTDYGTITANPSVGATGVYEDERLSLTFDEPPVLSETNGQICIYDSDNNVVDTLQTVNSNANEISDGTNKISHTIPAAEYNVRVDGNVLRIIPHQGALANNKTYKVVVASGVISGKINGKDFTGFAPENSRWSFTTREAKPSETANIIVGTSSSAHYRSLQSAIVAASDGAKITVEKGKYRELLFCKLKKSLTIVGDTTTDYGADVIIEGSNAQLWASGSDDRCMFAWGGNDLTLKNITFANVYDRNIYGTAQSEAIYFNSNGKFVAYNSSFKGHQDTLLTKGKNWFYKCYVEGDTDFVWGYADVALFEECKFVQLDTSSDKKPADSSYIFETRVGSDAATSESVGKGYVLFNTAVESKHPQSYLARRASASGASGSNYYDQVAIINTVFTGTINEELWGGKNVKSDKNDPVYIAKDANGNMNVGWKIYGGSGYATDKVDAYNFAGTIKENVYKAEYSGRNVILNRVYKKTGKYANADAIWDVSSLAAEFNATTDTSSLDEVVTVAGANGTYDIESLALAKTEGSSSFTAKDRSVLTDGCSDDGYVSWAGMKNFGAGYGVYTNSGTITINVAGASVIRWTSSQYSKGTVTVTNSSDAKILDAASCTVAADKGSTAFIYSSTEATTLTLTFSGDNYINNLVVKAIDDEVDGVGAIAVEDASVKVGKTASLNVNVTKLYMTSNGSVTYESSDKTKATVDSNGVVTGIAEGSVTITVKSVQTPTVTGTCTVTIVDNSEVITTNTYDFKGTNRSTVTSFASKEDSDAVATITAMGYNGGYGAQTKAPTDYVQVPVKGDAIVYVYQSYTKNAAPTVNMYTVTDGTPSETAVATVAATAGLDLKTDADLEANKMAFLYTGDATELRLVFGSGNFYFSKIVVKYLSTNTYDFKGTNRSAVTSFASKEDSDAVATISAMGYNGGYGAQTKAPTDYVQVPVKGDAIVYVYQSYTKNAAPTVNMYTVTDGTPSETAVATVAATAGLDLKTDADLEANKMAFLYTGDATELRLVFGSGNFYFSKIVVKTVY